MRCFKRLIPILKRRADRLMDIIELVVNLVEMTIGRQYRGKQCSILLKEVLYLIKMYFGNFQEFTLILKIFEMGFFL